MLLLTTSLFLSGNSLSASNKYPGYEMYVESRAKILIHQYFNGGVTVTSFSANPGGVYSIVAGSGKKKRQFYLLPDMQTVIEGKLYSPHIIDTADAHGAPGLVEIANRNKATLATISGISSQKKTTKSENVTPPKLANKYHFDKQAFYEKVIKTQVISKGSGKKQLYVFFDFMCQGCREAHKYLDQLTSKHDVTVNYIPVGVLGEESIAKATYSLIHQDNAERIRIMEALTNKDPINSVIKKHAPKDKLSLGYQGYVNNTATFRELPSNRQLTPTFVYLSEGKAQVSLVSGKSSKKNLGKIISLIDAP